MSMYSVCFYKDLLSSDGQNFKCLQRQIEVQSDSPSGALVVAEREIDYLSLGADCIEVTHKRLVSMRGSAHPTE